MHERYAHGFLRGKRSTKRHLATASILVAGIVVIAAFVAAPSVASDLGGLCSGPQELTVGQWARYQTDVPLLARKMEARYAIVGREAVDGKDHYWLELTIGTAAGDMILQFLIPSYPFEPESLQRAVMKMNAALPAMEFPAAAAANLLANDNLSDPLRQACEASTSAVEESVTVPAGTFDAHRVPLKRLGKDIWVSPSVPFAVVKMVDSNGKGLELLDHGTGAESSITETPQKMPGSS